MSARGSLQSNVAISSSIRNEILRFESVHPSIYAIYDIIEAAWDPVVPAQINDIKDHVVSIEDSFVNSQEWTLSRAVKEIRLGVLGTCSSGKASLVHRYLTGYYVADESPEGGRFKKELVLNRESHLLLIRDEGEPPEMQFAQWVDAVIFVFSLENEVSFNTIYSYYAKMCQYRNMQNVPIVLVGTQDAISETSPRIISDIRIRKLTSDLKQCQFYEACATYGLNVDKIFEDACLHVLEMSSPAGPVPPFSNATGQMLPRSHNVKPVQHSQDGICKDFDMGSYASIPAESCNSGTNHISQGHSPPFREPTPSENVVGPPPPQRPERKNRRQSNKDRDTNVLQMDEEMQVKLISISNELSRLSAPLSSQTSQHFLSQQGHELVYPREISSPFSTPNLARKKISASVQKSSSFSASGLQRHGSQLSLQIDMRELPSVRGSFGLKEKFTKRFGSDPSPDDLCTGLTPLLSRKEPRYRFSLIVDRIDLFFKEFQVPKDKDMTPLTPLLSLIPRHRSYSVQDQSGDSSKDFSTPNTTPTQSRKNRRRSNIFAGKKDDDKKLKNEGPKGVGRVIPIKQGWLYKRSNKPLSKDWQKKYVTLLDDGRLTYHSNLHDYMENAHGKEIKLIRTTVKIPGQRPKGSEACQQQPSNASRVLNGQASRLSADQKLFGNNNDQTVDAVVIPNSGLKREIDSLNLSTSVPANDNLVASKIETPIAKKKHRRIKSSSKNIDINSLDGESEGGFEFVIVSLDNKQWHFEASSVDERKEWIQAIEQQILSSLQLNKSTKANVPGVVNKSEASKIRMVEGNNICADCGAHNPDWASLNLGEVICIECSGIHRNLGTHMSRVRSLELDEWPLESVDVMTTIGNQMANGIWECNIGVQQKPSPSSSREEKEKWIRRKYEQKEFLPPLPHKDVAVHQQLMDAVARQDVCSTILVLAHSSPDQVVTPYSSHDTRTALHIAAALGNVVIVQLLIWYGANVEQLDHEGNNAAFYAELAKSNDCVKLLQPQRNSTVSVYPHA